MIRLSNASIRRGPLSTSGAFTLIELLIVVAIIAILAAIAVPNFLNAQVRAKVARAQADMRTMVTAIESYRVDNNRVPPRWGVEGTNFATESFDTGNSDYYPPAQTRFVDNSGNAAMAAMTTPIAYITTLYNDPFATQPFLGAAVEPAEGRLLDYIDEDQGERFIDAARTLRGSIGRFPSPSYVLSSVGPDTLFGHRIAEYRDYPREEIETRRTFARTYDPTNGTLSVGNIYRFSGTSDSEALFTADYLE